MENLHPPIIDMTPDGQFVDHRPFASRPQGAPSAGITLSGILVRLAGLAIGLAIAAFLVSMAVIILPFIMLAGVIGYFALRHQLRRGMTQGPIIFRYHR